MEAIYLHIMKSHKSFPKTDADTRVMLKSKHNKLVSNLVIHFYER